MKKILVVGSLNMDTVIETPRIPVPGETIMEMVLSMCQAVKVLIRFIRLVSLVEM